MSVSEVYELHIRSLTDAQRMELLSLLAKGLSTKLDATGGKQHSIMELRGLGKEIWGGIDPDKYVRELRTEWEHRA